MRILMVLESEFPPDARVEKEIKSLLNEGHELHLACYTFQDRAPKEKHNGYTIHRKPVSKLIYKSSAGALIFPFYVNFWKKFIGQIVKDHTFDAIHIHDLPLSKVGYYFKEKYQLKLICDQHEFYSDWIVHTAHYNTVLGKIVKLLSNWKKYEKKYLNKADLVITVEEPLRRKYLEQVEVSNEKIISVPNTPDLEIFHKKNVNNDIIEKYKNHFVIFYAGGIDLLRGIDLAIHALPIVKDKIPNIRLVLAGKMAKRYNPMETAKMLHTEHLVEFIGWLSLMDLPSYIAASQVCFFTPPPNRYEINHTIATKIYQYAAMGKPIIVSEAKMMKEFIEQHHLGISVKHDRPDEFADAILTFCQNKELRNFYRNGEKIMKAYSWDNTVKKLLDFYKE